MDAEAKARLAEIETTIHNEQVGQFLHGKKIMSIENDWYEWNGVLWEPISRADVKAEAYRSFPNNKKNAQNIKNFVSLLKMRVQIRRSQIQLAGAYRRDDGIIRINFPNVIVCVNERMIDSSEPLKAISTEDHNSRYLFTKTVAYKYNPAAVCALYRQTLRTVMPDEYDRGLWRIHLSTIFLPYQRFETALILHGTTRTGKSTILHPVIQAIGKANFSAANLEALASMKGRALGILEHAMLNVSTEINKTNIIESGNLKSIFSGEDVWCDRKYQEEEVKRTPATFIFATNHPPRFGRNSDAEMRRIRFIPMNQQIPEKKVNADLKYALEEEGEGILYYALSALPKTLARNLCPFGGKKSKAMWNECSIRANPLDFFIQHHCMLKGSVLNVRFQDAYRSFLEPYFFAEGIRSYEHAMWVDIDKKYPVRKISSKMFGRQKRMLDGISLAK